MIGVCLLTCGRDDLSVRTMESFSALNKSRPDIVRLHAACGGGERGAIGTDPFLFDFRTVHAPPERVPQIVSFRKLIEAAAVAGAEFILWLENDWESVAAIPTIEFLRETNKGPSKVQQWRLFGKRKMQKDGPRALAGEHQIGTKEKIKWGPSGLEGWEFGRAHWGAGGTIATLDFLEEQSFRNRLKDVITSKNNLPTLRPRSNIMFHIGDVTTEGFRG
jgi:hypothetical protein